jgi:hypothetical protein
MRQGSCVAAWLKLEILHSGAPTRSSAKVLHKLYKVIPQTGQAPSLPSTLYFNKRVLGEIEGLRYFAN